MTHGLELINRYSGLPATVVSWDVATDAVILKLSCGQEANYSIQDISQLWLVKKPTHGGKREGAGRPKTKEDTVVMRVPLSLVEKVKALISSKQKRGSKR